MDQPSTSGEFAYPAFYNYPPYFTVQPVKDTRERQSSLWGQLILAYCKHYKVYVINVQEEFALFVNKAIDRRLSVDAIVAFLDDLVAQGSAEWVDAKTKRQCMIYWRKVPEWADMIHSFVRTYGLGGSVMLVDELRTGEDVMGTDLAGLHRELLLRALRLLEAQGKCKLFKGQTPEEEGVKFT
mmetsp:Transcript_15673/g.39076  ORF Transcript_15673/g.39076 Transcript_15673/m.39076 type:complete len:183 (-) Transcript_15673:146-694(-)